MAKEGESYLDELLNTVAPDWEETAISPENMLEDFDEELENEVSLEDALAILDDLPDSGYEDEEEDKGWDEDDLAGVMSDFETDDFGADMAETPSVESSSDGGEKTQDVPESDEMPMPDDIPVMDETPEPEQAPAAEPEKKADSEEESVSDGAGEEDGADIPLGIDETMSEEDVMGADIPVFDEADSEADEEKGSEKEKSSESIDVDDIFQDALSAVGYSGGEEEEEDFFSVDDVGDLMENEEEGITSVPAADPMSGAKAAAKEKKKGPGFFARIFGNIITDQTAEEEEKERQEEEAARAKKAADKEEKKKQAEISKEEKAQLAQEAKERKKQLKAEQAAQKAEKKEEKKRLKEERKAEEAAQEVVGKINPVGAAIVVIFFATIGIFTVFGSILLNRNIAINNAENYFASGEYMQAYDAINMVDVDEENDVLYKRIRMCTQMQKELDSYSNYLSMGSALEALDSLVKGINYYDMYKSDADSLGIANQLNNLQNKLTDGLVSEFGMTADEARELLKINDQSEYTRRLEEIVNKLDRVPGTPAV